MFGLLLLFLLVPSLVMLAGDPSAGLVRPKAVARSVTCEELDADAARRRFPGTTAPANPRGDFALRKTLACAPRIMARGERPDRDERLLGELQAQAVGLVQRALARGAGSVRVWQVEAFYPDAQIAQKVAFAVKVALMERQQRVSDRRVPLAAGDILVLGVTAPEQAAPLACARYKAEGSLQDGHAALMITLT
ncbi:MAG TPA: hypothetical protein VJQ51_10950, partial [Burkholderiales bacterium]|nr:hypothetical protein [Burkholderiales bacterium]